VFASGGGAFSGGVSEKVQNLQQQEIVNNTVTLPTKALKLIGAVAKVYDKNIDLYESSDEVIEYKANIKLDENDKKKVRFSTTDNVDYNSMYASFEYICED
jgi:uncharacterized protein YcfJ